MTVISDFVGDQIRQGQRGIAFGENHGDIAVLHSVVSEFPEMKQKGVATAYVEYVPAEKQELLTKALNGHEKSQKELRAIFEASWGFNNGTAQERYNALFAAHKSGIRVVAVDTPHSQGEVSHDYKWDKKDGRISADTSDERRLQTSDAYITRQIKEQDDGKPFIVLYGRAHTYAANVQNQSSQFDNGTIKRSAHGGLDARLTEAGIPTVSIDMIAGASSRPSIALGNGVDNQFVLLGEQDDHSALPPINVALAAQGALIRLHTKLNHLAAGGQQRPETLVLATEAAHVSRRIIDRLLDGKTFESQEDDMENLVGIIGPLVRQLPNMNEALYVRRMSQDLREIMDAPEMRAEIKAGEAALNARDAKQIWNPNVKVDVSPLQSQFDQSSDPAAIPEGQLKAASTQRLRPSADYAGLNQSL